MPLDIDGVPVLAAGLALAAALVVRKRRAAAAAALLAAQPSAPPLGQRWRNVIPRAVHRLETGGFVVVSQGSVVDCEMDAIVNAANCGMLGGGGVDGAISKAGGPELLAARKALPVLPGKRRNRCATGGAKITVGGRLNANWCIHAVGPNYRVLEGLGKSLEDGDRLLHGAYLKSMQLAKENGGIQTVGFSLLSAGIFRGPRSLRAVLDIAVRAVLDGAFGGLEEVHLVAFTEEELDECCAALGRAASKGGGRVTPGHEKK
jgi:O-acetyl-ADP-ribose deacetylase (regulator of RNase III)